MPVGIYVHVPFCSKKCPYCDFYSKPPENEKDFALYTENIKQEIFSYPSGIEADTIYFGGGTPSLLPWEYLSEIFKTLGNHFIISPKSEITIECNPEHISEKSAYNLRKFANRLSLGLQSCNDNELEFLGRQRTQKTENILKTTSLFENISADVIIGFPNQKKENIQRTLETFAENNVKHISAYILKVEKNTPFYLQGVTVDDDNAAELYLFTVDFLEKIGFKQYEISNFAKIGYESRHNLKYWKCEEYIGFGATAHSFFGGVRYFNDKNLNKFITDTAPATYPEKLMLALRLTDGFAAEPHTLAKARKFQNLGYLTINKNKITLTPKGFLISNTIISELL